MSTVDWPATLPARIPPDYQETRDDHLLRTRMEAGTEKVRRRFAGTRITRRLTLMFDNATELAAFDALLDDTGGGALPIRWTSPISGSAETFRLLIPEGGLTRRRRGDGATARYAVEVEMEVV